MILKNRKWRIRLVLGLIFILSGWLVWQFLPPPVYPPLPENYHPQKAVWMEITWSMDTHTDAEIKALAENLRAHEITTVFAYVSYLKEGDFFNPTFDYAKKFTAQMHIIAPEITLLAWIGVPINITTTAGERIHNRLANTQIQQIIADFSRQAVEELGFDGIHLNAEPISDGSIAFIETLQAIRSELPTDAILSLAAHALHPIEPVLVEQYPKTDYRWSDDYLRTVAENSDQVAIMAYDSGLFLPRDYRLWMAYQARTSAAILAPLDTQLFIGVPTSEEWTLSHNLMTEYVTNALYGVHLGLSQTNAYETVTGIAVYPYWEIDSNEWKALDQFR